MKVQALREQCVKHNKHIVNGHIVKGFNAQNTSQSHDLLVGLSLRCDSLTLSTVVRVIEWSLTHLYMFEHIDPQSRVLNYCFL